MARSKSHRLLDLFEELSTIFEATGSSLLSFCRNLNRPRLAAPSKIVYPLQLLLLSAR